MENTDEFLEEDLYARMIDLILEDTEMSLEEKMQEALNGPFSELRDNNFVTPNAVLVYTEATDSIEEVDLMDLPLLYPCKGQGARWSTLDLGEVVADKAALYRQSMIAHEISDEDAESTPTCGTVVLCIPNGNRPYSRVGVKANIIAGH